MPIEIQRTAIVRGAVEMAISDAAAREDATEWLEFSLRVEPYPRDSQSVAMVRLAALYRALLVVHDEMERLAEPLRPSADNRPPEERVLLQRIEVTKLPAGRGLSALRIS